MLMILCGAGSVKGFRNHESDSAAQLLADIEEMSKIVQFLRIPVRHFQ